MKGQSKLILEARPDENIDFKRQGTKNSQKLILNYKQKKIN